MAAVSILVLLVSMRNAMLVMKIFRSVEGKIIWCVHTNVCMNMKEKWFYEKKITYLFDSFDMLYYFLYSCECYYR